MVVTTGAPPAMSIFDPTLRRTSIGILIIITLIAFEAMAVATALPSAARDLHGIGAYGWAFTGFLVANIVGMVISGQVSDAHGARRPLVAGLTAFLAGLVLAGSAEWMSVLIVGRVVQGLGGGLLITAIYVVIGQTYPEAARPKLFAATSSAWVVPSLVGPVVAGALTQHASWRWVFLGLVPFALAGSALMVPTLRNLRPPQTRSGRVADPHRLLFTFAVAGGIALIEQFGQHPSWWSIPAITVGAVAIAVGLREIVPKGTFTLRPGPPAPIALRGLISGAFFGVDSVIPLSLTVEHGYGATAAGLPLACAGLTWAMGSWIQGRPPRGDEEKFRIALLRWGASLIALGAILAAVASRPSVPGALVYVAWSIAGLGAGLTISTVSILLLKYTNDAERGSDSAALQLADATGAAMTTGLAGVLVAAAARGAIGYPTAFTTIALVMAGIAGVATVSSGRARAPR